MIFISYRRQDEPGYVGRLADGLAQQFGPDKVFRDIDSLPAGNPWKDELDGVLQSSFVVLAVIGRNWLRASDFTPFTEASVNSVSKEGARPDNSVDYVHYELHKARELGVAIIPVLLNDSELPDSAKLADMAWLGDLQTFTLHDGQNRWDDDVSRLAERIAQLSGKPGCQVDTETAASASSNASKSLLVFTVLGLIVLSGVLGIYTHLKTDSSAPTVAAALTDSHSSSFPLPLGQVAHDWEDGKGLAIVLDAIVGSQAEKLLNNLQFPPSSGEKSLILAEYCQHQRLCIRCKPSVDGNGLTTASLVTISLQSDPPLKEVPMKTADGNNNWPIQEQYLPWENIDSSTGKRSLFVCVME